MDLGAMVCLPNGAPLCEECPAQDFCVARREGTAQTAPRPARRKSPGGWRSGWSFSSSTRGGWPCRRRPAKGLLAGLWEYPNELAPAQDALAAWGLAGEPAFAGTRTHIFTHVEWRMTALRCALEEDTLPPAGCGPAGGSWRRPMPSPAPSPPFRPW